MVDDNAGNRALVRDLLVPLGFDLIEAEGGERALELSVVKRPALILMDLAMPDLDGYETTRRLRRLPEVAKAVIVASSASVSEAERQKSLSAGCDDFLPKPLEANALFEALQRTLGLAWTRRERPSGSSAPVLRGEVVPAALLPPPADDLAQLSKLADRGRIRSLLDELVRLEGADPRLGPWSAEVRALAQRFQVRKLRELLRGYASAEGGDPSA